LQGQQLVAVRRPGSRVRAAVTALLNGPTAAEQERKVRTYMPAGTAVRAVSVADGVATVDLGERFAQGRDAEQLDARIAQLVFSVTSVPGVKSVRILVGGGMPLGLFPGYALSRPVTPARAYRYGPLAGVLRTGDRYGIVLQKGSPLTARVDAAVRALVDNGTVSRLQRRWLSADLGRLRVLG
jgi:hypothetical protein